MRCLSFFINTNIFGTKLCAGTCLKYLLFFFDIPFLLHQVLVGMTNQTLIKRKKYIKVEAITSTFYGRHHDLVDRYGISVSQKNTDMFHLS